MDDQTKRKLRTRRTFSGQIRKQAVDEFRSGKYSVKELAGLYHCSKQTIYRWIHQYSPADQPKINVVEMSKSDDQKVNDIKEQKADLKRNQAKMETKIDTQAKITEFVKKK